MKKNNTSIGLKEIELDIVFVDDDFIIVNKPSGVSVDSNLNSSLSLQSALYEEFGEQEIQAINRIDQPVSGLVIYGRNSMACSAMSVLFKSNKVRKEYWAVVHGNIEESGVLEDELIQNSRLNKSFIAEKGKGKLSILNYESNKVLNNYTLLRVFPKTGRHHQIRVQLAHFGYPVKGDVKYGARRGNKDRSIYLHARGLSFVHPFNSKRIDVVVNPIQDSLWSLWVE